MIRRFARGVLAVALVGAVLAHAEWGRRNLANRIERIEQADANRDVVPQQITDVSSLPPMCALAPASLADIRKAAQDIVQSTRATGAHSDRKAQGASSDSNHGNAPLSEHVANEIATQPRSPEAADRVLDEAVTRGYITREDVLRMRIALTGASPEAVHDLHGAIARAINTYHLQTEGPSLP